MRKFFILLLSVSVYKYQGVYSQTCNIEIAGNNCLGTILTAKKSSGSTLSELRWYNYGNIVFVAGTITTSNSVSIVAGGRGSGSAANQFGFPAGGIAIDKDSNIYVADTKNNRIQKWAPGATSGITVAGGKGQGSSPNQLSSPQDVFVDTIGNLYIADMGNHRIQKWIPGAVEGTTVAGGFGAGSGPKQLQNPSGVYVDANGYVYIADKYNYRIQRWAPGAAKGITVAGGTPGTAANQFSLPVDVYVDKAKNIYVADAASDKSIHHRIQKWAKGATSGVTIAGGNGVGDAANQFNYITALTLDAKGNLYVADAGNRRVTKWTPGATSGVTVAGGYGNGQDLQQLHFTTGVCIALNKDILVFDAGTYAVKKFIPTFGIVENKYTPQQPGSYKVEARFENGCTVTSLSHMVYAVPSPQIKITPASSRANLCEESIDTFYVDPWDDATTSNWKIPSTVELIADKGDSVIIRVPENFTKGLLIVSQIMFAEREYLIVYDW